jgi:hypothetical protein
MDSRPLLSLNLVVRRYHAAIFKSSSLRLVGFYCNSKNWYSHFATIRETAQLTGNGYKVFVVPGLVYNDAKLLKKQAFYLGKIGGSGRLQIS